MAGRTTFFGLATFSKQASAWPWPWLLHCDLEVSRGQHRLNHPNVRDSMADVHHPELFSANARSTVFIFACFVLPLPSPAVVRSQVRAAFGIGVVMRADSGKKLSIAFIILPL